MNTALQRHECLGFWAIVCLLAVSSPPLTSLTCDWALTSTATPPKSSAIPHHRRTVLPALGRSCFTSHFSTVITSALMCAPAKIWHWAASSAPRVFIHFLSQPSQFTELFIPDSTIMALNSQTFSCFIDFSSTSSPAFNSSSASPAPPVH